MSELDSDLNKGPKAPEVPTSRTLKERLGVLGDSPLLAASRHLIEQHGVELAAKGAPAGRDEKVHWRHDEPMRKVEAVRSAIRGRGGIELEIGG